MLTDLEHDCLYIILSNLSYVDRLSFRLLNKSTLNLKVPKFKDIFVNRLLEHNIVPTYEDALIFCDNLYSTGAYVAGSFILDCLYNVNYHQDIDIFDQTGIDIINYEWTVRLESEYHKCCDEEKERKFEYCDRNSFQDFESNNLKFTQSLYKLGFGYYGGESISPNLAIRSYLHKSNPKYVDRNINEIKDTNDTIQIIPIDLKLKDNERSVIPRFIKATFDLEICQNSFDGKSLYIKNMKKLIYKYDYIKPNTRFILSIYEQDVKIKNNNENKTKERMKKYIKRGFNIQFHPQYYQINENIALILKKQKYNFYGHQNCKEDKRFEIDSYTQDYIRYIDNGEIDLSKHDLS